MILKNNTLWQCSCHCNTLFVTYEFVSWKTFQIRLSSGRVDSSEQHNGKCCMVLNCFWVICLHLHSTIWNCFCLFLLICSESGPWIGSKNVVHSTWAALSEVSFMTRMCDFYSVKESLHKKILCFFLWKLLSFGFWKFWRKRDPSFWTQEKWKNGWPHVSVCLIHCWVDDLFWIQSWVGWLEHTKHGICWLSEVHFLRIQMCSFYRWKESLHMKSSSYFCTGSFVFGSWKSWRNRDPKFPNPRERRKMDGLMTVCWYDPPVFVHGQILAVCPNCELPSMNGSWLQWTLVM